MKMFRRMLVYGRIATAHVTARKTLAQMNPGAACLQAFFTAVAARRDISYFARVSAGLLLFHKLKILLKIVFVFRFQLTPKSI